MADITDKAIAIDDTARLEANEACATIAKELTLRASTHGKVRNAYHKLWAEVYSVEEKIDAKTALAVADAAAAELASAVSREQASYDIARAQYVAARRAYQRTYEKSASETLADKEAEGK